MFLVKLPAKNLVVLIMLAFNLGNQFFFSNPAWSQDEAPVNENKAPIHLLKQEAKFDPGFGLPDNVKQLFYKPGQPLMGELKHSEYLNPVDSAFRPGSKFDEKGLPKLEPNDLWMWVPTWLAGAFSVINHTTIFTYNFINHKVEYDTYDQIEVAKDDFGQQADRQGNVWTYIGCPYANKILTGDGYNYQLYSHIEPVLLSTKGIIFKGTFTAVHVTLPSGLVSDVQQYEGLSARTPIDDNHVRVEDSVKTFDQNGKPLRLVRTTGISIRNADFKPIDWQKSVNLITSFHDFLRSHGLQFLIPEGATK